VIVTSGIVSVQVVKVSDKRSPPMVVAEEFKDGFATNDVFAQLIAPTPVVTTAGPDEVLVKVVEPAKSPPPGSPRSDVDAEADVEPRARRPMAIAAASVASLRMIM
jgi:hypothetical protein